VFIAIPGQSICKRVTILALQALVSSPYTDAGNARSSTIGRLLRVVAAFRAAVGQTSLFLSEKVTSV